jgi:hypothetical protein
MTILDYLDPLQSGLPITLLFITITLSISYLLFFGGDDK